MSEFKGTPGPWRLFMTTDGRKLIGIGDRNGGGVTDAGFGTWRDGEEQLANARLISAAPELLTLAQEVLAVDDDWKALSLDQRSRLEAVIAKATGSEAA